MDRVTRSRRLKKSLQFTPPEVIILNKVRFAMAKVSKNRVNKAESPNDSVIDDYVNTLSTEHKMLVVLKAQLYGGKWATMLDDLENRLAGKPYIFKLTSRIKDDVQRIRELQAFEAEQGVDLADYVELT